MLPQEIIRRKRNKDVLSPEEIREFIAGIGNHTVDDVQVAAMTMAIFLNGLNREETVALRAPISTSRATLEVSPSTLMRNRGAPLPCRAYRRCRR